jgi:hypothetical protein
MSTAGWLGYPRASYLPCHDGIGRSTRVLVAWDSDFVVAGAAIDRAIILGQEWDLRLDATLGTNDGVHFAWGAFARTPTHARRATACCAARWTTTRLVHQTFLLVKLLFTGCEYEIVSALTTIKGFVFEVQLGTSL